MTKRRYQAKNVNKVNREQLVEVVNGQEIVVGIDVAKEWMYASLTDRQARVFKTVKWQHPGQSPEFIDLLDNLSAASIEAAMEPTGTYGDALRSLLNGQGIEVYRVGAKRVHDAAEVYDGVPSSHDAKAAGLIAKLHVDGASVPWVEDDESTRELTAAIRLMSVFSKQYDQHVGGIEALLARHWPEASKLIDLQSVTLLTLLEHYGGPAAVAQRSEEAARLMRKVSRGSLNSAKVEALLCSAQQTVGVAMVPGEVKTVKALAADTLRAKGAEKAARKDVERLSRDTESTNAMGQVVGQSTAAVLACKVGDPLQFDNAAAYEKSAGLNLKVRSSGQQKGKLKITKRGSGYGRQVLYMAVLRLIQHDPVVQAWYQRKTERDGGLKMKALIALMRKLIRALWHVAQGVPFDSTKLFDVHRLEGALAAAH